MRLRFFGWLFLILLALPARGQQGIGVQWEPEFSYTVKPAPRWSANLKLAVRNSFTQPTETGTASTYQLNYTQAQLFATYTLWTSTQLTGGYGFRFNDLLESSVGREHRLMEQLSFLVYVGGTRLANRFRAEQRFIDTGYRNRWRYRLAYETPLQGQRLDPGEQYLITANEILFSFYAKERTGENRLYLGIGWYTNTKRKLEAGLQYRLEALGAGQPEHVLWLTTAFYLNQ